MIFWSSPHCGAMQSQVSLRKCTDSTEPSLLTFCWIVIGQQGCFKEALPEATWRKCVAITVASENLCFKTCFPLTLYAGYFFAFDVVC